MKSSAPLVTIGLPVFNGERYLEETLDSLLDQTWRDFVLIVSDNASTDRTPEICARYAAADRRVRYSRLPANIGVARNYRRLFDLSESPYFKWASADDLAAPRFLERCLQVLENRPEVVLAYPKTRLIDETGALIGEYDDRLHLASPSPSERFFHLQQHLRLANALQGVIRSDVLRRTSNLGSYLSSDCVLLAELALHGKFYEVPEVLFSRRIHPEAYGSNKDVAWRLRYYNPNDRRRFASYHWRRLWELARVIERSPIPPSDRRRLRSWLLKSMIWGRRELVAEALAAVRWAATTRLGRPA